MQETLLNILRDVAYVVIIGVIPIISKYVICYLQAREIKLSQEVEDETFETTRILTLELIQNVVDMVSQTYVDSLKNKGEFTKEAQAEAFNRALTLCKELMSDSSKEIIEAGYKDLDSWIGMNIESYIKSKK